jgi:hypothetical protein
MGDDRSDKIWAFLVMQGVQQPFTIPTNWLDTGHVDEVIGFTSTSNSVIIADPNLAYTTLSQLSATDKSNGVFFAKGPTLAGTVTGDSTINPGRRIETGINLSGMTTNTWKYIRIYSSGNAGAKGQIGLITGFGNGFVLVGSVWDTTSNVAPDPTGTSPSAYAWCLAKPLAPTMGWVRRPVAGDKFVLIKDSQLWRGGIPAAISVTEVLNDWYLLAAPNQVQNSVLDRIAKIKNILNQASGVAGGLAYIPVPQFYFAVPTAQFDTSGNAIAFNPGLSNFQLIGGTYYFPRQFGPRDGSGADVFETKTRTNVPGAQFIDDWTLYHAKYGEVHCGSYVLRDMLTIPWWNNQ